MKDVVLSTKSWCGDCTRAKALLTRKSVAFDEVEISSDNTLRDEMVSRAGGKQTVPQRFIGDTHIGGYDDLYERENEGKLDALLA